MAAGYYGISSREAVELDGRQLLIYLSNIGMES